MNGEDDVAFRQALPPLAQSRLLSLRRIDDVLSLVLDVAGLDGLERDRLEVAVKDSLRDQPGVSEVRVAMRPTFLRQIYCGCPCATPMRKDGRTRL